MAAVGFSLRGWLNQGGKKLIWGEFGLGGGLSRCGDVVAKSAWQAGVFPYLGIQKTFEPGLSPWDASGVLQGGTSDGNSTRNSTSSDTGDTGATPREMLERYYDAALALLAQGGGNYPVDAAFLWNLVSWDVQGVHPASRGDNGGSYADEYVVDKIQQHNSQNS